MSWKPYDATSRAMIPVVPEHEPGNIKILERFAKPKYQNEKYKKKPEDERGRKTVFKEILPYSPRKLGRDRPDVLDRLTKPTFTHHIKRSPKKNIKKKLDSQSRAFGHWYRLKEEVRFISGTLPPLPSETTEKLSNLARPKSEWNDFNVRVSSPYVSPRKMVKSPRFVAQPNRSFLRSPDRSAVSPPLSPRGPFNKPLSPKAVPFSRSPLIQPKEPHQSQVVFETPKKGGGKR